MDKIIIVIILREKTSSYILTIVRVYFEFTKLILFLFLNWTIKRYMVDRQQTKYKMTRNIINWASDASPTGVFNRDFVRYITISESTVALSM